MEKPLRYTYRIDLKTTDDVREFTKIASNTISVESDFDCFFDFRRFIVKNN